jgi:adenosylcobyric acid synthase
MLMVQGCSSWAGKSLIATALCRHFARRGVAVAPFKGQNMANNARVVDGGEVGVAQWLQARAARVEPDVRMNPVLVKPEGHTASQVVVHGRVDHEVSALPWRSRGPRLWPAVEEALGSLLAEYELLVGEGAGSPAEINLADVDHANTRVAHAADARVLLVADIDRGGSFAHLYGTWALLDAAARARIGGFILNRFRGDPALLAPGPQRLEELTGVPVIGIVPWMAHGLPDEDRAGAPPPRPGAPRVAVVRYPTASNLDELKALEQVADVRWAQHPEDLTGAQLVVLPGSKHVAADLAWLRESGLAGAVSERLAVGGRVLALCGGLQMAGMLELLPLHTHYAREKLTRPVRSRFAALPAPWAALSDLPAEGYEIRQGRTEPTGPVDEALPGGLGWVAGPLLALYPHGLLEAPAVVEALLGERPARTLDDALDDLCDRVMAGLDVACVEALAGLGSIARA